MKLSTIIAEQTFTTEKVNPILIESLGKLNKANKSIRMEAKKEREFSKIANLCDRGVNQRLLRKQKRQQNYLDRLN